MKKIIKSEIPCPWIITVYVNDSHRLDAPHMHDGSITSTGLHQEPTRDEQVKPQADEEHAEYNAAINGLESLILAHACAGVDIEARPYIAGIESALEAIGNNL